MNSGTIKFMNQFPLENNLVTSLQNSKIIEIQQRLELAELFGFETRNKYEIRDENGKPIGYAAEQQRGILQFLVRQFLGHWRRFDLIFFDLDRRPTFRLVNRFRWLFQYVEVFSLTGESSQHSRPSRIGALEQRFALFSKRFDVHGANGETLLEMRSPLWRIWTFTFFKFGQPVAVIEKKWTGLLSEAFTDRDRFRIRFESAAVSRQERVLLLAASLFVDLNYFEQKSQ